MPMHCLAHCAGGVRAACIILVLTLAGPVCAQVLLTEILADPASDWNADGVVHYRDDEWIEVTNIGGVDIDLTNYFVRDGLGEDLHLRLSGLLSGGEAAVFYGSDAVAHQQANSMTVTGLSLNNGGDTVQLVYRDPDSEELTVTQSYTYADHSVVDDRAAAWFAILDGWGVADGLNAYLGEEEPLGTGCEPSPGEANGICTPSVDTEEVRWGSIKTLYR